MTVPKLTLVTQKGSTDSVEYLDFIARCLEAGVDAVQLREKALSPAELYEFGHQLRAITRRYQRTLIINDHLDLALALQADGLHLGQSDGDVIEARKRLGTGRILGLSINSLSQLQAANSLDLDYVGIGAVFATTSKTDVQRHWGLSGLKEAVALSRHPAIAIGGINSANAEAVLAAGAKGLAAIAALHQAVNLEHTIAELIKAGEEND